MVFGLFLIGLGAVVNIKANIGYSPWEVLHVGMSNTFGISIGVAVIIAGIIIVILVTALGEKFGLGSIICMFLTGMFIDIIIGNDLVPLAGNLVVSMIMLIGGYFSIAFGTYFYIKSAFGTGPRDNLMVVLVRKTKLPVGLCRCIVELFVTLAGWIMGGMIGIGTVIAVIAIGPCVQVVFKLFRFDVSAVKHETIVETYTSLFGHKDRDGTNHTSGD